MGHGDMQGFDSSSSAFGYFELPMHLQRPWLRHAKETFICKNCLQRAHPDLNQGPADLQSAALTTERCTRCGFLCIYSVIVLNKKHEQARPGNRPVHTALQRGCVGSKVCNENVAVRCVGKWGYGATAARLTPDQKVGSSNLSGLIFVLCICCGPFAN